ncbi:endonuclease/exonuclease/phosphatase family protein [Donghicola mangrovi]|uniref:endonuclease/exonuclease/phosphatase family protein n=1 Tax=Donghicola mangrovi TaxID=2729614 RepID=UPI0030B81867
MILLGFLACLAGLASADPIRIATYNTELGRKGPGLLLRAILSGDDPQVEAVAAVIAHAHPDILLLQGIDYDLRGHTLTALAEGLARHGIDYPHRFARLPNAGLPIAGTDPPQFHSFGRFAGSGGMAILSRFPIEAEEARDFSDMRWRGQAWTVPPDMAHPDQRLSTMGHWDVPVRLPTGVLHLLAFHATPPVFDGPQDENGLRNGDEVAFWQHYLDGDYGPAPERFVILGDFNNDPELGEGVKPPLSALLADTRLRDPTPNAPTVDWSGLGLPPMRVSYILPDKSTYVTGSGTVWPPPDDHLLQTVNSASRHRLVWADIVLPPPTQENLSKPAKQRVRFLDPHRANR